MISNQMGEVKAEKLFRPITSGLKDLTLPKIPIRRKLTTKKMKVPDYGVQAGDDEDVPDYGLEDLFGDQVQPGDDEEVPDYGLEDLFGEQVQPQNNKKLVPKPPSYEDVLKDLASGEKQIYIDPEYMPQLEDLPPEYEEEEVPDYSILEEDRINEVVDKRELPNYDDLELQLNRKDMTNKLRKQYLTRTLKKAKEKRDQLPGHSTAITKKLQNGSYTKAEAQYHKKNIQDTRNVLIEYINYIDQKIQEIPQKKHQPQEELDLPVEYVLQSRLDNEVIEEVLDTYKLPQYNYLELQLNTMDTNTKKKKAKSEIMP